MTWINVIALGVVMTGAVLIALILAATLTVISKNRTDDKKDES